MTLLLPAISYWQCDDVLIAAWCVTDIAYTYAAACTKQVLYTVIVRHANASMLSDSHNLTQVRDHGIDHRSQAS